MQHLYMSGDGDATCEREFGVRSIVIWIGDEETKDMLPLRLPSLTIGRWAFTD